MALEKRGDLRSETTLLQYGVAAFTMRPTRPFRSNISAETSDLAATLLSKSFNGVRREVGGGTDCLAIFFTKR
jgi:hypothetical protein